MGGVRAWCCRLDQFRKVKPSRPGWVDSLAPANRENRANPPPKAAVSSRDNLQANGRDDRIRATPNKEIHHEVPAIRSAVAAENDLH